MAAPASLVLIFPAATKVSHLSRVFRAESLEKLENGFR